MYTYSRLNIIVDDAYLPSICLAIVLKRIELVCLGSVRAPHPVALVCLMPLWPIHPKKISNTCAGFENRVSSITQKIKIGKN